MMMMRRRRRRIRRRRRRRRLVTWCLRFAHGKRIWTPPEKKMYDWIKRKIRANLMCPIPKITSIHHWSWGWIWVFHTNCITLLTSCWFQWPVCLSRTNLSVHWNQVVSNLEWTTQSPNCRRVHQKRRIPLKRCQSKRICFSVFQGLYSVVAKAGDSFSYTVARQTELDTLSSAEFFSRQTSIQNNKRQTAFAGFFLPHIYLCRFLSCKPSGVLDTSHIAEFQYGWSPTACISWVPADRTTRHWLHGACCYPTFI